MKIKVFNFNANGKVEFTKEELENLLTEVYEDGISDGKSDSSNVITWYNSPHLGPTCSATLTTNDSETTTNHACCNHTKDCDHDCNCHDIEYKDDIDSIESSVSNFDVNAAKKMVNDVFSALAKELGL